MIGSLKKYKTFFYELKLLIILGTKNYDMDHFYRVGIINKKNIEFLKKKIHSIQLVELKYTYAGYFNFVNAISTIFREADGYVFSGRVLTFSPI